MPVSMSKIEQQAPELVSLVKSAQVNLNKSGLGAQRAKVALALDFSGSMRSLYRDGTVQRLAEQILALGTQFDDDGAIDLFIFHGDAEYLGELTIDNFRGAIDRLTAGKHMGSTNYAAVMRLIRKHYAGESKKSLFGRAKPAQPAEQPAYVMFITDGQPDSRTEATRELVEASSQTGIFYQFMGLGKNDFRYLERLDSEVKGRLVDNANFFDASGVLPDDELYAKMLAEFPDYIREARKAGLIR